MASSTRRVVFPAAGGGPRLEGFLHVPGGSSATRRPAAVVCHPHSLMGGSMENGIIVAVCRALAARGIVALRFNFRGVGRSEGAFDGGRGEMEDVAGAVDLLEAEEVVDPQRLAVVGYSFGAEVGMRHAARDPRLKRIAAIAPVQEVYGWTGMAADPRPKLFIVGENDPWAPADALQVYVARLAPPKALHVLPGTDHFFVGRERAVATLVAEFLAAW